MFETGGDCLSGCRDDPGRSLAGISSDRRPDARERLVELYLPLVRALARRFAHRGERLDDLVQVGSIGLIDAIDRFDPERGADFPSFAIPTITGEIKNHLRDRAAAVRVPRGLAERTLSLQGPRTRLAASLGRAPTLSELAHEAGIDESAVAEAIETEQARTLVPLFTVDEATERFAPSPRSTTRSTSATIASCSPRASARSPIESGESCTCVSSPA